MTKVGNIMTEQEFWAYLKSERKKGKAKVMAGSMVFEGNDEMAQSGRYMTGHSILPEDYQNLPREKVFAMGELLFKNGVNLETKEAVLIWLAHQPVKDALVILNKYRERPDDELRIFGQMAYDECLMWDD